MQLWLVSLANDQDGYDMLRGAVVRAESAQGAWEALLASSSGRNGALYPRDDYVITPLRSEGGRRVILADIHEG
jgi:hypothetical protein